MSEYEEVSVGRDNHQFALAVFLVERAAHIALRQCREERLHLLVERVDIAHVDIIGEAPVARRRAVLAVTLKDAHTRCLAMDIGVIAHAEECLEPQYVFEEPKRGFDIRDMHEGRDLDKVHSLLPPRGSRAA
jgi:hypothetical protein